MKISVITVSDRASAGIYEDRTGPEIERLLRQHFPDCEITRDLVADEYDPIMKALEQQRGVDFILTTGGTGISPRDITPDVTREFCQRELPGISEVLRAESYRETPNALLSRGFAGMREGTIVVNFPGSMKAVKLYVTVLAPVLEHAMKMKRGETH